MSVAARLKATRLEKGLSLRNLAQRAGIPSFTTIHQIEQGINAASVEQVRRLAEALGVSPCWLAFGKKEEKQ